jgi:uncharacterized protein
MNAERVLARITERIVRSCEPQAVVLFGSFAKGQQDVHSDIDILVVGRFAESAWLRGRELRASLREFPLKIDLLLLTPAEAAQQLREPFGFLASVLGSSVTLYGSTVDLSSAQA